MQYSILSPKTAPEDCAIFRLPPELPYPINPSQGDAMGEHYPPAQRFEMAQQVAGLRIPDVINNALGYWMVSGRLKALLEAHAGVAIEFLRFTLINHKGRVASEDCWIANVLGRAECIDRAATVGKPHAVLDGQLASISKLALDPKRIPADSKLFRIAERPRVIVVRDDLRAVLERERVSGVEFLALGVPVRLA